MRTRHEPRTCPRHGTPLSADGRCDECGGPAPDAEEAKSAEESTDASLDYAREGDENS